VGESGPRLGLRLHTRWSDKRVRYNALLRLSSITPISTCQEARLKKITRGRLELLLEGVPNGRVRRPFASSAAMRPGSERRRRAFDLAAPQPTPGDKV
jgi:hypothetical protein